MLLAAAAAVQQALHLAAAVQATVQPPRVRQTRCSSARWMSRGIEKRALRGGAIDVGALVSVCPSAWWFNSTTVKQI